MVILTKLFLRCFLRTALSAGFLRSRLARVLLAAGILLGLAVLTAIGSVVLRDMIPGRPELLFALHISTVPVVFWTLVVFVFVKVLFTKSDGLIRCTAILPVSHRERSAALALYELGMVVAGVVGLFLPLALASVARIGFEALPGLAASILLTAVAAYLVLSVLHNLMVRAAEAFGLKRLVYSLTLSSMVALTFWYNSASITLVRAMSRDYLGGGLGFYGVNGFPFLGEKLGLLGVVLVFLAWSVLFLLLALLTSPATIPLSRRFVKAFVPFRASPLWPTAVAIVRRSEWWIAVVVASFFALLLWVRGSTAFVLAPVALLSQGIYVYAVTDSLRRMPGYARGASVEVWRMVAGQLLVTVVFAVPVALLVFCRPQAFEGLLLAAVAISSGAILTTLIAVVIVAENDSPPVVFFGYALCLAVIVCLAAMVGLLQIATLWLWIGSVCANILAVVYSVAGVKNIMRRKRHEASIPRR
ncbi:hypothetical protein [Sinomonas susongensis]|uniref:hypothetical protein n=1 Tax=Sinomonas susongensis TaxID=1324851 RepID=UPI0011084B5D|nr:hypothetical protein [Sinomonas susongensis]